MKTLNSKPVKLRLKIDLVSYPARAEGLVNMDNNFCLKSRNLIPVVVVVVVVVVVAFKGQVAICSFKLQPTFPAYFLSLFLCWTSTEKKKTVKKKQRKKKKLAQWLAIVFIKIGGVFHWFLGGAWNSHASSFFLSIFLSFFLFSNEAQMDLFSFFLFCRIRSGFFLFYLFIFFFFVASLKKNQNHGCMCMRWKLVSSSSFFFV